MGKRKVDLKKLEAEVDELAGKVSNFSARVDQWRVSTGLDRPVVKVKEGEASGIES